MGSSAIADVTSGVLSNAVSNKESILTIGGGSNEPVGTGSISRKSEAEFLEQVHGLQRYDSEDSREDQMVVQVTVC
jgi:hypothetical protein